uniref:PfkB family carbohydrate kinase n=1 Tax=Algoriphagus sp. TaxID=1872435 RepID=UPI0040470D02
MKTVFVSGHFNILHPGHLRLLRFAKECGDKLIVGVESDLIAGNAAHISEDLRLEGLQSLNWIDDVFIMRDDVVVILQNLRPNIVVKGKEHELQHNSEQSIIEQYGGQLIFSSGEKLFSSVDLIRKEFFTNPIETISYPKKYFERHKISKVNLLRILNSFSKLKICVIGDIIVDEYITCQPLGMSQEDPTIVVSPIDSTKFLGGAGIVAAHASGLGAEVNFISVTGNDSSRKFVLEKLNEAGVVSCLLQDDTRPTTLKQRFRSKGKSLLRVSYLHQDEISKYLQKLILEEIDKLVPNINLFVFSDFNYGCLPQSLVEQIIAKLKNNNILRVADSQSSSQVGDISRFFDMDLITPTEHEARISTRNQEAGLVVLADHLKKNSRSKNILLKMGEEGLLVHGDDRKNPNWFTDRVDALNSSPKDVAGAGDSLLITAAMTMACGGNIWEAAGLGSIAAAVQVGRVGNIPLRLSELIKEIS